MPPLPQAPAARDAANVYQGVLSGANRVTFFGAPLVAPVSSGVYRRFRVVNVRVAPGSATVAASVAVSGPNAGLMSFIGSASTVVGTGATGFTTARPTSPATPAWRSFFNRAFRRAPLARPRGRLLRMLRC